MTYVRLYCQLYEIAQTTYQCVEQFNSFRVHTLLWCFTLSNARRFLLVNGRPPGQERVKFAVGSLTIRGGFILFPVLNGPSSEVQNNVK